MAMFGALGRKKGPFDMAGDFPGTPGIGDGLPQNQQYDPGMGSITPAPEKKGVDWGRIAGIVSDGLAGAIGQPGQYAASLRQQKEREYERQQYQQQLADRWGLWKQQQDYARENPESQVINTGDGGIASVKGDQVSMIRQPDPPRPGEQERLISLYTTLPDGDPRKPLIERAIRGYQYTAPAIAAKTEAATTLEGVRQGNRVQLKGMTGRGGGRRASKPPAGFILDN